MAEVGATAGFPDGIQPPRAVAGRGPRRVLARCAAARWADYQRIRTRLTPRRARPGAGCPGSPARSAARAWRPATGQVGDTALVAVQDGPDAFIEAVDILA